MTTWQLHWSPIPEFCFRLWQLPTNHINLTLQLQSKSRLQLTLTKVIPQLSVYSNYNNLYSWLYISTPRQFHSTTTKNAWSIKRALAYQRECRIAKCKYCIWMGTYIDLKRFMYSLSWLNLAPGLTAAQRTTALATTPGSARGFWNGSTLSNSIGIYSSLSLLVYKFTKIHAS